MSRRVLLISLVAARYTITTAVEDAADATVLTAEAIVDTTHGAKRVVRRAAPGVETHNRCVEPGLRRACPENPRREGQVPGRALLQRAGQLLRGQRVPALRDEIGNDGAYIAKGPKLGLSVGGRRGELGAIVPRSVEHPAFRQVGVPDRERRAVLAHDVAHCQQRLRPPLAIH